MKTLRGLFLKGVKDDELTIDAAIWKPDEIGGYDLEFDVGRRDGKVWAFEGMKNLWSNREISLELLERILNRGKQ